MKKIILVAVTMLIHGISIGVQADPINFRDTNFASLYDESSATYIPAGLTITPGPEGNATLYWDKSDGIGVMSSSGYEYDEIEGSEFLHLSFETPQILKKILITDLFYEPYKYSSGSYREIGEYSFDNESWTQFEADQGQVPGDTNGVLSLLVSPSTTITDIWFRAPGLMDKRYDGKYNSNHEFSVAGIDVTPVPEPATMLLLGSGLAGIISLRRRYKK